MNSETLPSFVIGLRAAACERLSGVQHHVLTSTRGDGYRLSIAVPASYDQKLQQRYPLLVLFDSCSLLGSAIEMSRLMSQTKEVRDCIIVAVEAAQGLDAAVIGRFVSEQLLAWCHAHYRVDAKQPVLLFSTRPGHAEALKQASGLPALHLIETPSGSAAAAVPTLAGGLRKALGTGHEYGSEVTPLQSAWITRTLGLTAPLVRMLRRSSVPAPAANPYRLRSQQLQRDFEIFVALPASAAMHPSRRYPALLVLDASIEFSTVAETAARLAAEGCIDEIAVIGIGVPRCEGPTEFAFRRFEEFSPPAVNYTYDDPLGRIFRSLFYIRGEDARVRLGRAPAMYGFLTEELLPLLLAQLPIDAARLGLLGHSAGGTFVGYALAQEQSPFRYYAGISPGVAISGHWIARHTRPIALKAQQVFLCIGSEEQTNRFNVIAGIPDTAAYAEKLRSQGGLEVRYRCYEGETHSSVYPPAVSEALTQFFSRSSTGAL